MIQPKHIKGRFIFYITSAGYVMLKIPRTLSTIIEYCLNWLHYLTDPFDNISSHLQNATESPFIYAICANK